MFKVRGDEFELQAARQIRVRKRAGGSRLPSRLHPEIEIRAGLENNGGPRGSAEKQRRAERAGVVFACGGPGVAHASVTVE